MLIRTANGLKDLPLEIFVDTLSRLTRQELCCLQLVGRYLHNLIDDYLMAHRPHLCIMGDYRMAWERRHIVVTTEDAGLSVDRELNAGFGRYHLHWERCHIDTDPTIVRTLNKPANKISLSTDSSSDFSQPIPRYLGIHDFTLIYGKLVSTDRLRRLENIGEQWEPCLGDLRRLFLVYNKNSSYDPRVLDELLGSFTIGMRFSLEYSRRLYDYAHYNQPRSPNETELSGEAVECILSRLVLASRVSLHVVDMPRLHKASLFATRAVHRSYTLRLIVDGECHQTVTPDEVVDYALAADWDEAEAGPFNPLFGRRIHFTANMLKKGNDSMALLAQTITQVGTLGYVE